MVKKIIKAFKILIASNRVKKYLLPGKYYYYRGRVSTVKKGFFLFFTSKNSYYGKYDSCDIRVGCWSNKAIVRFCDSYCFLYFCKKSVFENIVNKSFLFNYPKMSIFNIDSSKKMYFSYPIIGSQGPNKNNLDRLCKLLIKECSEAQSISDPQQIATIEFNSNFKYYLQHGDPGNFIETDSGELIFIDFDTIGYRTALFDYLDLLLRSSLYYGFGNLFEVYSSSKYDLYIAECFDIDKKTLSTFKDECLMSYLSFKLLRLRHKKYGIKKLPHEFAWINIESFFAFPKTLLFFENWLKKNRRTSSLLRDYRNRV